MQHQFKIQIKFIETTILFWLSLIHNFLCKTNYHETRFPSSPIISSSNFCGILYLVSKGKRERQKGRKPETRMWVDGRCNWTVVFHGAGKVSRSKRVLFLSIVCPQRLGLLGRFPFFAVIRGSVASAVWEVTDDATWCNRDATQRRWRWGRDGTSSMEKKRWTKEREKGNIERWARLDTCFHRPMNDFHRGWLMFSWSTSCCVREPNRGNSRRLG